MPTSFTTENVFPGLVLGVASWGAYKLYNSGRREPYLPPGPPTKPLLGNIFDFPLTAVHEKLTEWARQYGDIYSVKLLNNTIVVLSSLDSFKLILEKNSAQTSGRPPLYVLELLEGVDTNMATAQYGPRWRSARRAAQQILSPQACRSHLPIQQAESLQLLFEILNEPEDISTQLRRAATSTVMSVMFGVRIPFATSQIYLDFTEVVERLVRLSAATTGPPVDLFPVLKLVPERFAQWKKDVTVLRELQRRVLRQMLAPVEQRMSKGEANGCAMEMVYERAKEWELDDEQLLYFGAIMLEAGAETTSTFLTNFSLILAAHPWVQEKLHEEIDRVIENDRMPIQDDFERLPYLQAVINEVHRFRPVTPLGVPHTCTEDIWVRKYVIPKGTTLFQNNWALLHDESVFKDQDRFYPERFLEDPELAKYLDYVFGAGRRACAGIHLAKNSIAINSMNLVWGFFIHKAVDQEGNTIEPNLTDYLDGLSRVPKEVRCSFKTRSPHHEQIMRQAFHDAEPSFRPFEKDIDEKDRLGAEAMRYSAI